VNAHVDPADIAAMREQGDLKDFLLGLTGRAPAIPKQAEPAEDDKPLYHIPRKGAWPCGTAASGPTPPPCTDCQKGETA
jgi:hypothetical protein